MMSLVKLDHDLKVTAYIITAVAFLELVLSPIDRVFAPGLGFEATIVAAFLWIASWLAGRQR